jgi:hypothetical protein
MARQGCHPMSKTLLHAGSIRVILENSKIADRIFKPREQNECAKSAMLDTVKFWTAVFLPQRFDDKNQKYLAHTTKQWDDRKREFLARGSGMKDGRTSIAPQPRDLVFTGIMRQAVMKGARPWATSTKASPKGRVAMPTGHAVQKNISRVLRHVPVFEYNRLCEVFKAAFNKAIVAGEAKQAAAKQGKADAKVARKAKKKALTEARRSARADNAAVKRATRKADKRLAKQLIKDDKRQAKFTRKNADNSRKKKIRQSMRESEKQFRQSMRGRGVRGGVTVNPRKSLRG